MGGAAELSSVPTGNIVNASIVFVFKPACFFSFVQTDETSFIEHKSWRADTLEPAGRIYAATT